MRSSFTKRENKASQEQPASVQGREERKIWMKTEEEATVTTDSCSVWLKVEGRGRWGGVQFQKYKPLTHRDCCLCVFPGHSQKSGC